MILAENLFGMEIIDGSKAKVMHNEIVGNLDSGIYLSSFFFGEYIGAGDRHRIHKNLIHGNGWFGILANGLEKSVISCNRLDDNFGGLQLESPGFGNNVIGNVANWNVEVGLTAWGGIWAPDPDDPDDEGFVIPVAEGNKFKRNTALNNGVHDLSETFIYFPYDDEDPVEYVLPDECKNKWRGNTYETSYAVKGCIRPSKRHDDDSDDSCAPDYDDFDDDSDSDDDSSSDDD